MKFRYLSSRANERVKPLTQPCASLNEMVHFRICWYIFFSINQGKAEASPPLLADIKLRSSYIHTHIDIHDISKDKAKNYRTLRGQLFEKSPPTKEKKKRNIHNEHFRFLNF